jgi:hypothetical protein
MKISSSGPSDTATLHSRLLAGALVRIDLGQVARITGVAIDGGPGSQHLTSPLTLSISQDGKEWVRVWKAEAPPQHGKCP